VRGDSRSYAVTSGQCHNLGRHAVGSASHSVGPGSTDLSEETTRQTSQKINESFPASFPVEPPFGCFGPAISIANVRGEWFKPCLASLQSCKEL
jgi:hypothetical protein